MDLNNGTGVQYPTIDLGGKAYPIRWTKAMAYDMSVQGINLAGTSIPFHQIVDGIHLLCGFEGTKHQLAEILYGRAQEAYNLIMQAVGKVAPPKTTQPLAAAEEKLQNPVQ